MLRSLIKIMLIGLLVTHFGCADDDTEYNFIDRLRVLGISGDPPWLEPGESTTLSALTIPQPRTDTRIEYVWEWCPLNLGPQTGYACAFTEEELQAVIDEQLGPDMFEVPSFLIGTSTSAANIEYTYDLPPEFVRGICDFFQNQELPALVEPPDCTNGYPLTIISTVRQIERTTNQEGPADSPGPTRIRAIKTINLLFEEDAERNNNPHLGELFVIDPRDQSRQRVALDGSTTLDRDITYTLEVELDESESESYLYTPPDSDVPELRREALTLTWFIEAGSTDSQRTGFIEGVSTLEQARSNEWTTPREPDYGDNTARVFIVIRDGRLGTSWIERSFTLTPSS